MKKNPDKMHILDHLEELRWTIFKIIGGLILTTIFSFCFIDTIYEVLMRPVSILQQTYPEFSVRKVLSSPFDAVFIKMKIAFLGGIVLGFPLILFFLWSFIHPGMKKRENHAFIYICTAGTALFSVGVAGGYFLVAPILKIVVSFGMHDAENLWKISEFISFMFYWLLCSGLICELPLAIVILSKLGVVQVSMLKKIRPFFFIGAFVIAAIITPPDPFTMAVVGIPLIFLYELGIIFASIGKKEQVNETIN